MHSACACDWYILGVRVSDRFRLGTGRMPQVKGQALRKRNCTRTSAVTCTDRLRRVLLARLDMDKAVMIYYSYKALAAYK